ncbi:MAG: hypothetical protein FXF49_06545 [Flexistipes sinusarabici]|uniref:Uncharacterized protein n=1 Tax=Flexistipes sinusarabici TaxID=2352 RepID=A0A5D0MPE5_FLESI|nr:hypothetical protein [Flexistipes sinusarabici]TYB33390.1 MAG: hypothetical protein FXF49_06545 [Flexistipes sinusarabici]
MLIRWLPWKFIIKRAAKSHGFLDPLTLMAKLRRFGHPSEVQEPIELIRAGVLFHARGLVNTRVIQYNLDWVWPYWINKQFRPEDESFIPRGFSFSHINLTHRNWTAVGSPNEPHYPIVDPRGLLTPYYDGWSIDFWLLKKDGNMLIPAHMDNVHQTLEYEDNIRVKTEIEESHRKISSDIFVEGKNGKYTIFSDVKVSGERGDKIICSIRPYNAEGVQFVEKIEYERDGNNFLVNESSKVYFDKVPDKIFFSDYHDGDVYYKINGEESGNSVICNIGMATAAAVFVLDENESELSVTLPLKCKHRKKESYPPVDVAGEWNSLMSETAKLDIPDEKIQFIYDASVRTLLLLTADEAYPGPYTYKRFWFRDACLMMNALLAVGQTDRAYNMLLKFPEKQKHSGYFRSQEGEWDSNGQVLWITNRIKQIGNVQYKKDFIRSMVKGAEWICNKRIKNVPGKMHNGLLPAGFSAEHLGPNDYYYWDNFWALTGLKAVDEIIGDDEEFSDIKNKLKKEADEYEKTIFNTIKSIPSAKSQGAIPASPFRRIDSGAVGSLVADYPLQITPPADSKIMKTIELLEQTSFYEGAFFQNMIHSGINIYLTLAIAQSLLRAGKKGYEDLIHKVAELASPTGQWPEAIHPHTKGGCMGDGQHGWASAEWIMMIKNIFVRDEKGEIIIGSGIFSEWIETGKKISFGPVPVPGGNVKVAVVKDGEGVSVDVICPERSRELLFNIMIPGYENVVVKNGCVAKKLDILNG